MLQPNLKTWRGMLALAGIVSISACGRDASTPTQPSNLDFGLDGAELSPSGSGGPFTVWGLGPDSPYGRIYRWTGSNWAEPNPAARAGLIVGRSLDNGAWAIGDQGRIFTTEDGRVWREPDPSARASQITGSTSNAWSISGNFNRVSRSFNGGASWSEYFFLPPMTSFRQISAGNVSNVWALDTDGHILVTRDNGLSWQEPNSMARLTQISAMPSEGAWGIGADNRIFVTMDGRSWAEPNPSARATKITARDIDCAWVIGSANRVFLTENRGASWSEPNPQARLKLVAAQ